MTISRRLILAAALMSATLPAWAGAAAPAAIGAEVDRVANASIAAGETPGLQVAIFKDGKPLLVKSYGTASLELKTPVTNDGVFLIGSVTKQFTAAALLQLRDEGRLSMDDRLSKYYPDYPRAADITIRQMLHHTSGLHNYTADAPVMAEGAMTRTTDEWVKAFAKMPATQDFEPGAKWDYSNTAYFLLGGIVEKVEGKPLATVLKARFFDPLGMTRTALDDEGEIVPGRVAGYDASAPGKFRNARLISLTFPGGAGAMRSTASDLARWNAALFGGKVLKSASLAEMTTPGKLSNGQLSSTGMPKVDGLRGEYGYALALSDLQGHQKIAHGGGIPGFNSSLSEFPKDHITVAVIANAIGKDAGAGKVAAKIERIAIGLPPEK